MLNARIGKEVVVRAPNEPGCLATLTKLIADKGINVVAACAWVEGDTAVVRFVTDDTLRMADEFRAKNLDYKEVEVVVVDLAHKVGMLRHVTERFAERGIDLSHLYVTSTTDQVRCMLVCSTSNNERAMVALNDRR